MKDGKDWVGGAVTAMFKTSPNIVTVVHFFQKETTFPYKTSLLYRKLPLTFSNKTKKKYLSEDPLPFGLKMRWKNIHPYFLLYPIMKRF